MKALAAICCLLLATRLGLAAGPDRVERDLGDGLAYFRIHALPADLPAAPLRPGSIVLDLRYAQAGEDAVRDLGTWLQSHSTLRTPVLVLVNAATDAAVLDFLETVGPIPGLLTVGPPSPRFVPDIPIKTSSAAERTAYDALDHGATVDSLLDDRPEKVRHDEASLAQERTSPDTADEADPTPDPAPESAAAKPPAKQPVIDSTLQRAVQVHRSLRALRRI